MSLPCGCVVSVFDFQASGGQCWYCFGVGSRADVLAHQTADMVVGGMKLTSAELNVAMSVSQYSKTAKNQALSFRPMSAERLRTASLGDLWLLDEQLELVCAGKPYDDCETSTLAFRRSVASAVHAFVVLESSLFLADRDCVRVRGLFAGRAEAMELPSVPVDARLADLVLYLAGFVGPSMRPPVLARSCACAGLVNALTGTAFAEQTVRTLLRAQLAAVILPKFGPSPFRHLFIEICLPDLAADRVDFAPSVSVRTAALS